MVNRPLTSLAVSCCLLAAMSGRCRGAEDGLYAVFDTSMGRFTCQLDYQQAPRTVANFVRLARRDAYPWIDLTSGAVHQQPFYDGIIFHRVISGFVIQAGSPAGDGSDGPGYTFPDEFSPALRHSTTGVLSMANSGLDSNGSQFFITLAPTPGLDNVHSVFGRVTAGLDVVLAIGGVATGAANKPLTNVVIHGLTIVTNGAEAAAFDIGAPPLPRVLEPVTSLVNAGTNWLLQTPPQLEHEYVVYHSPNLAGWSAGLRRLYTAPPADDALDISPLVNSGGSAGFFALTDVAYPGPLLVPASLNGNQVTFSLNGVGTLAILLYPDGTGLWATGTSSGNIVASTWTPTAYNGSLTLYYDVLFPMRFSMAFDTPTGGPLRGTIYTTPSSTVTGAFTIP